MRGQTGHFGAVKGRVLAGAVLNLEDLADIGPLVVVNFDEQVNVVVVPVGGVVEGVCIP